MLGPHVGVVHRRIKRTRGGQSHSCVSDVRFSKNGGWNHTSLVVLSPEEVRRILRLVRLQSYRTCRSVIYSCGLRLLKGTQLKVQDIDSTRLMIHVRRGKGAKDRYVPLPMRTLELLRQYLVHHRNPILIFPA